MKIIATLALLASFLALSYADCGPLSPVLCRQFETATESLSEAFETSNFLLAEAITTAAQKRAALYEAALSIAKSSVQNNNGQTVDERAALINRLTTEVNDAEKSQDEVTGIAVAAFAEATAEMRTVLEEAIISARPIDTAVARDIAFSVGGSSQTLVSIKQKLADALKKAHGKLKEIIRKTMARVDEAMKNLEGILVKILGEAGVKKAREFLQAHFQKILKKIEDALAKDAAEKSEASFDLAIKDTEDLIDELEAETRVNKRGIADLWEKVKSGVKKLGSKIRDAAKSAFEKNKETIIKALKAAGTVVVNAGKDIIVQVVQKVIQTGL